MKKRRIVMELSKAFPVVILRAPTDAFLASAANLTAIRTEAKIACLELQVDYTSPIYEFSKVPSTL